ncbi:hypothetical protein IW261DRAFT_1572676 [Armillaria novae-zelandiae]|uniref:Uncharacterized protein n=1 Tax=Armillaria novae-zelandiae TaxID=153914 RepID=A0AA39TUX4_9AGAR|nr:hypothetical protein IW261DRAFT_1572676 [Armillaria novae-zelandiae]
MRASGCEIARSHHPCALRRLQPAVDAHLMISHEDNPLYDGEMTHPTLMNDSTYVRLARTPEAGKLPLAMDMRGEDGHWCVHAEWRGGAIGASVAGRAITPSSVAFSWDENSSAVPSSRRLDHTPSFLSQCQPFSPSSYPAGTRALFLLLSSTPSSFNVSNEPAPPARFKFQVILLLIAHP